MKTLEIKNLLHQYFEGETTLEQDQQLIEYFNSDKVAEELNKYKGLFIGLSELSATATAADDDKLDASIMETIHKYESDSKNNTRKLWQFISSIAASVILVIGGFLFYQQEEQPFKDTFDDPETAYAVAERTLFYVSEKYNQGLAGLSNFEKLETATHPLQQGIKPVNEYLELVEKMRTENTINQQ